MICTTARRASEQFDVRRRAASRSRKNTTDANDKANRPRSGSYRYVYAIVQPRPTEANGCSGKDGKVPNILIPPFLAPRHTLEAAPLLSLPLATEADRARFSELAAKAAGVGVRKNARPHLPLRFGTPPPRYAGRSQSNAVAAHQMLPASAKAPSRQGTACRLISSAIAARRVHGETDMLVPIKPGVCRAALVRSSAGCRAASAARRAAGKAELERRRAHRPPISSCATTDRRIAVSQSDTRHDAIPCSIGDIQEGLRIMDPTQPEEHTDWHDPDDSWWRGKRKPQRRRTGISPTRAERDHDISANAHRRAPRALTGSFDCLDIRLAQLATPTTSEASTA